MFLFGRGGRDGAEADSLVPGDIEVEEPTTGPSAPEGESRWGFFTLPSFNNSAEEEDGSIGAAADQEISAMCADLSYETRLYGFLFCFCLGTFMSISSSFFVVSIVIKPEKFALPYTLGNLLSLGSSLFFVGPHRFFRTMFNDNRRMASIIYLSTLFLTLFCALYLHSGLLTFIFIFIQFGSYLWLVASYIPYGRRMLRSFSLKCFNCITGIQ